MGLKAESWGDIESICPVGVIGLLSETQDEVWDFFEKPAWHTYDFEQARNSFGYSTNSEFVFPVSPCPQDPLMDSHDASHSYLPCVLCNYCESSDHAAFHCPCRAYVDATCASVERKINELADQMVQTMKKRIAKYS